MGSLAKWFCATCGNVTLNYVACRISKLEVIVNDKRSGFMFAEGHRETSLRYEPIQDDTFTIGIPATGISSRLEELKWVQRVGLLVNLPPALTCGAELWGVTETIRSATRLSEMSLLGRAARLRTTDTSEELRHSCL